MFTNMRFSLACLWVLLLLLAETALARTLINGGRVYVSADQAALEAAQLVIEGDRILAVNRQGRFVRARSGDQVVDATGSVITPGLLESVSVAGLVGVSRVDEDFRIKDYPLGPGFEVARSFNPWSPHVARVRATGITTAVLIPASTDDLFRGQSGLVNLSGEPSSVEQLANGVHVSLGEAGADKAGGSRALTLLRLEEALLDAKEYMSRRSSYRDGRSRRYQHSQLDLEALAKVLNQELPLVAEVERAADILALLRLKESLRIRVIILSGSEAWRVASSIAEAEVPVIVSTLNNTPADFDRTAARMDIATLLHEAGVQVALSQMNTELGGRTLTQVAGNAVAYGLPWDQALRAVTLTPAEIWGLDDELGSLEPGKRADLVIWQGDPLELTSHVTDVMIAGKWQSLRTRQTELLKRYVNGGADSYR